MIRSSVISILFLLIIGGCSSEGSVTSVAHFSFNDYGESLEVVGGWNYSGTKYETSKVYCKKALGICTDVTGRIINNHLNIATMVWSVERWDDDWVEAVSGIGSMYQHHRLCINRRTQAVEIVSPENTDCMSYGVGDVVETLGQAPLYK